MSFSLPPRYLPAFIEALARVLQARPSDPLARPSDPLPPGNSGPVEPEDDPL